jgi:hypothetical protein
MCDHFSIYAVLIRFRRNVRVYRSGYCFLAIQMSLRNVARNENYIVATQSVAAVDPVDLAACGYPV